MMILSNGSIATGEYPVDYDGSAPVADEDGPVTAMIAESADDMRHLPSTVNELFRLRTDGARHEMVDGSLLVSPAPSLLHQVVLKRVFFALDAQAPQEYETLDTSNLKIDEQNLFIPDIVVASADTVFGGGSMLRPADVLLAVEIVSPSTRTVDRFLKLSAYAEAGIANYWRVEPGEGPILYPYDLTDDGTYRLAEVAPAGKPTALTSPFPITVDPADWIRRR